MEGFGQAFNPLALPSPVFGSSPVNPAFTLSSFSSSEPEICLTSQSLVMVVDGCYSSPAHFPNFKCF